MQPITLSQLGFLVRQAIDESLPDKYWVRAEISSLRRSGHCYMELVEKDENNNTLIAKMNATMWRNVLALVDPYFERETGMKLSAGMKVLLCVTPQFHELYGMTLNVVDIDPTYTTGDLEQNRQRILSSLRSQGIIDMNRELTLPRPTLRIAIISSSSAAGYGDFMNQIEMSRWNFRCKLFEATMQGANTEPTIIAALDTIACEIDLWDCVVIIRGGGATSDLQGFDSQALAESVAQFPLPIITGLGHERDNTILDLISHTRCKTPTAAAEFLVDRIDQEATLLAEMSQSITMSVKKRIIAENERFRRIEDTLPQLFRNTHIRVSGQLDKIKIIIQMAVSRRLDTEAHRLELIEKTLEAVNPLHILSRGYSLTTVNGKVVRNADNLTPGNIVTTRFASGEAEMSVIKITPNEK